MADFNHCTERISLHAGNLRLSALRGNHLFSGILNINILIAHIPGVFIATQVLIRSARLLVQKAVRTILVHNNLHCIIFKHIRVTGNYVHVLQLFCGFQIIRTVSKSRNLCLKRHPYLLRHIWLTEPVIRQIVSERNPRIRNLRRNFISVRIAQHHCRKLHLFCRLIAIPHKQIVIPEQVNFFLHHLCFRCSRCIPYHKRDFLAVPRKCRRVYLIRQILHALLVNCIRNLSALCKTSLHFFVDLVHTAAADAVMRMILHQLLPAVGHLVLRICFPKHLCHCSRRLCFSLQCRLSRAVILF